MSKIIYWAVKLDEPSRVKLLSLVPPIHNKIYAEHQTVIFSPSEKDNFKLDSVLGKEIKLRVIGEAHDQKGQAVVVEGFGRLDGGIEHVTISCAKGTNPVYSNKLLAGGYTKIEPFELSGVLAKYTDEGWKCK